MSIRFDTSYNITTIYIFSKRGKLMNYITFSERTKRLIISKELETKESNILNELLPTLSTFKPHTPGYKLKITYDDITDIYDIYKELLYIGYDLMMSISKVEKQSYELFKKLNHNKEKFRKIKKMKELGI